MIQIPHHGSERKRRMKKETILELYYGKLNPMDMRHDDDELFSRHSRHFMELIRRLSEKLPKEQKTELLELCSAEMMADEILHRDSFCKGFQTGLRLAVEALIKEE